MKTAFFSIKVAILLATSSFTYLSQVKSSFANTATRLDNFAPIEIYVPQPETNKAKVCSKYIENVVNNIVERPVLKGSKWAILTQTIGGETIYSRNPDSYMIPASNLKLLVTAAALQKLNPEGKIRSRSIRDWIITTNLRSNNSYADILLRYLGGYPSVQKTLNALGIDPKGYRMRDGSGLSRNNLATPRTLVRTLRAMHTAKGKEIFLASLPIAGETGTLKNRLRYTTAQGTVRAKTGTLRGVRALSGYIDTAYGTLAFSAIANQPSNRSDANLVKALDEIVLRLSTIDRCN